MLDNLDLSKKEKIEKSNEVFQNINFVVKLNVPTLKKREPVFTLTELLEDFQISISPQDFNIKLSNFGIIEYSKNGWQILDLKFGENRKYQEKNNPKYYRSCFSELLELVLEKGDL